MEPEGEVGFDRDDYALRPSTQKKVRQKGPSVEPVAIIRRAEFLSTTPSQSFPRLSYVASCASRLVRSRASHEISRDFGGQQNVP